MSMIPNFKSIRIFALNSVDWDNHLDEPSKLGKQQLKKAAIALKEWRFQLLYICINDTQQSRQTAWHILDKMERAKLTITLDEFAELKRSPNIPVQKQNTVSAVLDSDQVQAGKCRLEQVLTKIAQITVFRRLNLSSKIAETHRQDVLAVTNDRWLELACLEPQYTPFGLAGGEGLIYTLQTSWWTTPNDPKGRVDLRTSIVDCEPIR